MATFALNDIPGYRAALANARQRMSETREDAWLNLNADICGFAVRTMTVADYALLDRQRSPFLYRLAPTLDDLKIFLWVLSPAYGRWLFGGGWRKRLPTVEAMESFLYGRKLQRAFGREEAKAEKAAVAAFDYVDRMFLDAPPQPAAASGEASSCLLGGWFDAIQSEHGLSNDEIWRMPLPQLFQRLKAIMRRRNPEVPEFNRFIDQLNGFILTGLARKKFTTDDLMAGRVEFPKMFEQN